MRFISTRTHGIADYLIGILLIIAPWLLGFANGGAAQWVPIILGLGLIAYSLLTDYELGVSAMIPMPIHLGLDIAGGAILAVSPWLFGFADTVFWPHLIVGLVEIAAGLTTRRVPGYARASETMSPR
ncbi:SPW repeat domain-containing protein [Chelativorans sp. M5D2P16]|uniref:SPW repeat domain-containing protein n=1 Tax=Chelativorans sp. M5D2P16 TaxID=3095678 RepID=UPI002ACA20F4|nr:SPW repeat protein [Chelativorans sp. M5D2P16]MDZ5695834.1 SPW repeat protein [Chelativorans sp. M5D2P16]